VGKQEKVAGKNTTVNIPIFQILDHKSMEKFRGFPNALKAKVFAA
jgi:hypothetical protein